MEKELNGLVGDNKFMDSKFSIAQLSRNSFALAIQKGLGRALMHVLEYGLNGVDDIVLDACLHNYCYDTPIDSDRANWLFRMFANSEYYSKFSNEIIAQLRCRSEMDDLRQLCGLTREMAAHGDELAKRELRKLVFEKASIPFSDDWESRYDWVELEGAQGVLDLAKIYGQRLLLHPDDFVPDDLFHSEKTIAKLRDLFDTTENTPELIAYEKYLEAREAKKAARKPKSKQERRERFRQEFTLDLFMENANNKEGSISPRYMNFGKYATTAELEMIYKQLFIETDNDVLVRLLWVFRRTPLPGVDDMIFTWASDGDGQLRSAAINALAQVSNPRIHDLAQTKVASGNLLGDDNDSLDLFLNNFVNEDIQQITHAIKELPAVTQDDAHSLGISVLDLSEKHGSVEFVDALKWVYENTPCSHCRYNSIKNLKKLGKLDPVMLYECKFDGESDIREFAQNELNRIEAH
jgi:hypothetical protein